MNYTKSILGKNLDDLKYQDIEVYFQNPRQESNIVEYKSYNIRGEFDKKLAGIYTVVCAFLNSDGGIIVWGAPEGKKLANRKEKEFSGALMPLNQIIEKDYLINKIADSISPLPPGLKVKILEKGENCVIVLEVERSSYAPHQTQNIYYMRLDGQSKPAPHHFIEALFKQVRYPNLGGYIRFESIGTDGRYILLAIKAFIINHSPVQNEENVSFRILCTNGKFDHLLQNGPTISQQGQLFEFDNYAEILHYGTAPFCDTRIKFDQFEIQNDNFETHLILMFGGKKSPMKKSEYKLRIKNLHPKNINDIVFYFDENELMYESGKDKGSEKEKVNLILGR